MTDNRFFTQSQRQELFLRAKGKCQNCSCEISLDDFHADHITPYSLGGKTELSNGQALCRSCNLKKSASLKIDVSNCCLLYTSPSPRDKRQSRMPSSA